MPVQFRPYLEPLRRGRMSDKLNYHLATQQRTPSPVLGDVAEHPVLDLVPFAGSRRKMAHPNLQPQLISQSLQGHSTTYDLAPFTTYDGALGVGKDAWLVQLYGENLTDMRAELYANYSLNYKAITVNRPRTIGLRFSYKFHDS